MIRPLKASSLNKYGRRTAPRRAPIPGPTKDDQDRRRRADEVTSMETQHRADLARCVVHQLERTVWQVYHQPLGDLMNDLRVQSCLSIPQDPSAEDVLYYVEKSRVFESASAPPIVAFRETLQRLRNGSIGYCEVCKKSIPRAILESNPSSRLCAACAGRMRTTELVGARA